MPQLGDEPLSDQVKRADSAETHSPKLTYIDDSHLQASQPTITVEERLHMSKALSPNRSES